MDDEVTLGARAAAEEVVEARREGRDWDESGGGARRGDGSVKGITLRNDAHHRPRVSDLEKSPFSLLSSTSRPSIRRGHVAVSFELF